MKQFLFIFAIAIMGMFASCSTTHGGAYGITDTEISTITESVNNYDLEVDTVGITYTIDISTAEGRLKLKDLSLVEAQNLALQEAAIKNNCARIASPKYSHLKKGKDILRITVFGFPARYKNKPKSPTVTQKGSTVIQSSTTISTND